MKTFKLLMIIISFATVFSACNFPNNSSSPTQIADQNPVSSVATVTLRVNPTQIEIGIVTPKFTAPLGTAVPMSTLIPPNTPVWSVYDYTCELASGGGTMTMNLAWTDRSNSEEGYKVYRDKEVIATLAANSTFYVDIAFVATGKALSYSVEAFNTDWRASTSTITHGCQ
jgi:hypothetical protein